MGTVNTQNRRQIFLLSWLAVGLTALHGLKFWPIGNYSTLVYLFFFTPLLIIIACQSTIITKTIAATDRPVLILLFALFFWVTLSSIWNPNVTSKLDLLLETLKPCILIFIYLIGIAYLTKFYPEFLEKSIIITLLLVAALATCSILDQYLLATKLPTRLSFFSVARYVTEINPAVAGIYFGAFTVISASILIGITIPQKLIKLSIQYCFIMCLLATLLTGTRSAVVGMCCSFLVYLFLRRKILLALSICLSVLLVIIYSYIDEASWFHSYIIRGGLGSRRPEIWAAFWSISTQNFLTGTGILFEPDFSVIKYGITTNPSHAHNFYIQLLYWTGIIGLTLYLAALFRILKIGISKQSYKFGLTAILTLSYFLSVQIFDVYNIFTRPSYYWPCIWLPIGIVLGLSSRANSQNQ